MPGPPSVSRARTSALTTRSATRGEKNGSCRESASTASSTRAAGSDLSTYARAPAAIASPTKSSSSCMLKTQISVPGWSARIRRMASTPASSGSERSSTTTSGRSRWASSTAWRPVRASPAISQPSCPPSSSRSPRRTTSWSSPMTIRSTSTSVMASVRRWCVWSGPRASPGRAPAEAAGGRRCVPARRARSPRWSACSPRKHGTPWPMESKLESWGAPPWEPPSGVANRTAFPRRRRQPYR